MYLYLIRPSNAIENTKISNDLKLIIYCCSAQLLHYVASELIDLG